MSYMVDVSVYDNHPVDCFCKECFNKSCLNARNAFYDYFGRGTIGRQRALFVEFYSLWFSCDEDWDDDDSEV